jgi:Skp family chaperone for outer membrane proteins
MMKTAIRKWRSLPAVLAIALLMAAPTTTPAPAPAPAAPKPAPAATAPAGGGGNTNCKVAFVDLQRVLSGSAQGKKLKASLEAEKNKAFAPLKTMQDQLDQLEQQISSLQTEIIQKRQAWDLGTLQQKQLDLQNLQMKYTSLGQSLQLQKGKIAEALMKKKDEILKPMEDKLNKIMEEIGKQGGYCLVMDVSPPNPNLPNFNPILYRDPALDITDKVIQAVDR